MDSGFVAWRARVSGCGDLQLVMELQRLARADRKCEVRMLVYLAEVEARLLHLARGYSSMFSYARATLRMSEAQTYLRIQAARVARTYPVVIDMLEEGALNLTTLKLLAPHLSADNHLALLERARDKSKRDVELLVAEIAPLPSVPTRLRKLPAPAARRQSRATEMPLSSVERVSLLAGTPNIAAAPDVRGLPPSASTTQTAHAQVSAAPSGGRMDGSASSAASPEAERPALATSASAEHATCVPDATPCAITASAEAPTSASTELAATSTQCVQASFALNAPQNAPASSAALAPQNAPASSAAHDPQNAPASLAAHAPKDAPASLAAHASQSASGSQGSQRARIAFALEASRASCKPLGLERFKLELTASQKLHDTLMQLQHLLRHQVPGGDLAVIVERALDELLAKTLKQRFAQVSKPRLSAKDSTNGEAQRIRTGDNGEQRTTAALPIFAGPDGAGSGATLDGTPPARAKSRGRYVPRAVVRAVSARDGQQCAFVSSDGLRCSERGMLELHHVQAFARGGAATVENLKWVCRAHNDFLRCRILVLPTCLHCRFQLRNAGAVNSQRRDAVASARRSGVKRHNAREAGFASGAALSERP